LFRSAAGAALAAGALLGLVVSAAAAEPSAAAAGAQGQASALLRGPIHEAFATQIGLDATAGMIVPKRPPEPIAEVPPDVRPAGDHVSWIPGYWGWDDGRKDFLWVSGVWRNAPPGRRWVPGYWSQAEGGWRWNSGAWIRADAQNISYLPVPKASLERGPTSPQPSPDDQWIPGSWLYRENKYEWRPGFWGRGDLYHAWIPDHYLWTPRGAIFVDGYWDYRLDDRGTLFAPVAIDAAARGQAGFRYTPSVVIDPARIFVNLFVRPEYHHYYFGDYYGDAYTHDGIYPWYEFQTGHRGYDPLLSYYVWKNEAQGVNLISRLTGWYEHFLKAPADLRPLHTLADAQGLLAHTPALENVKQLVLGRPLGDLLGSAGTAGRFVNVTANQLQTLTNTVGDIRHLADLRLGMEAGGSASAGAAVGHLVEGTAGATAAAALKLPAVEQPLDSLTGEVGLLRGLPVVGGSGGLLPGTPRLPPVPGLPGLPGVPRVSRVPGLPEVPGVPGAPGVGRILPSAPPLLPNVGGGLLGR